MRRAAACALLSLALSACTTTTIKVKTQPSTSASTAVPSNPPPTTERPAKIGDTIQIDGQETGELVDVTVVKLVDLAKGSDEFTQPDKGNRFVAVQVKLANAGSAVYDDAPGNGAVLVDDKDQTYEEDINTVKDCKGFAGFTARIAPGSSRVGCIVFQVPKTTKLAKFDFTLDSGFGPETGEWVLQQNAVG